MIFHSLLERKEKKTERKQQKGARDKVKPPLGIPSAVNITKRLLQDYTFEQSELPN